MKRRAARVKGLLGVGGHACPAQLPAFVPNQGRASCGFAQGPAYFRKSLASFLACPTTLASALTRHHALASTRRRSEQRSERRRWRDLQFCFCVLPPGGARVAEKLPLSFNHSHSCSFIRLPESIALFLGAQDDDGTP
ncbi:hypothetical protein MRX96_033860 [Rhipicephalus microplus]